MCAQTVAAPPSRKNSPMSKRLRLLPLVVIPFFASFVAPLLASCRSETEMTTGTPRAEDSPPSSDPRASSKTAVNETAAKEPTNFSTQSSPPDGPGAFPQNPRAMNPRAEVPSGFQPYTHPLGVQFYSPSGWRVEETALGLQVTPPQPGRGAFGPTEFYAVTVLGSDPTITGIDDPKALRQLTLLMQQSLPFLRSTGPGRPLAAQSEGRRFEFAGTSPTGQAVECHVSGFLIGGYFLSLTALGEPAALKRREATLGTVARSLKLGAPSADPELAGTWFDQNYSSAGTTSSDRINVSTQSQIRMLSNGTIASSTQSAVSGATGGSGRPGGNIAGLTDPSLEAGRWARSGQSLYVLWKSGGVAKYTVYVQGPRGRREMLLTAPNGNKILWTEYRP